MLSLKKIKKSYKTGDFIQHALKGVSLQFRKNEFVAILGPSGSGKTTLLNIIGGLDRYDEGNLIINNRETKNFKDSEWDAYRNNCIGFIFQSYNLIGHIDVLANVEMGMTLSGVSSKERRKKALEVLDRVGLSEHAHKRPNQLSGGQMQRVAIARALANDPDIILADEPTGALDSKTSVQIMELIQEIAKDKLVIMVTHNPELAHTYATRIIEMKDGEILSDSNPLKEKEENSEDYTIKKTSMGFLTSLKLSLNNIRTKKGRTILTAFASSIGIIGIALILSLSNGFDQQISKFEGNTLSTLPVIVQRQSVDLEQFMQSLEDGLEEYPDTSYVIPLDEEANSSVHQNVLNEDYVQYIENLSSADASGINYSYAVALNLLAKGSDGVSLLNTNELDISSLPHSLQDSETSLVQEQMDILAGNVPTEKDELLLVVDSKNRVSKALLDDLGFDTETSIDFDSILGKEIKVAFNDDYYKAVGNYFVPTNDLNALYDNENNLTLKIVGVARLKEDYADYLGYRGLYYTNDLIDYVISQNENSQVVQKQLSVNYNVLSGEQLNEEGKETVLDYLGYQSLPYVIYIYTNDFDSKERIITYLDDYNKDKAEEDQIVYLDQADMISSLSGNIMDGVTIVLIAFSSISLVVSSIMIGIIMYISVLERTKEIGILRSLGARKKDISRVFNSETFIIGLASGLIGILIAWVLLFPINHLLYDLTELENVAVMNPIHALILIIISLILTLIGGWIPAKLASKKDPVVALRTE